MRFLRQTWALVKKDLLLLVIRRWLTTFIRALAFPIVFIVVLAYIRVWTETPGYYGIGNPSPVRSLPEALAQAGHSRNTFVIIGNGFTGGDIGAVVDSLSTTIRNNGRDVQVLPDSSSLSQVCPSSSRGVSNCFGAVEFLSAPDHGSGSHWNYTLYADGALDSDSVDVRSDQNAVQLYQLPWQKTIDTAIASVRGGSGLPDSILQYPFTAETESEKVQDDFQSFQNTVETALGFAFFVGLSGLTYHAVGHICQQREKGILQLIDAMMPNPSRWSRITIRNLATHLTFDLIYLPGFIITGGILSAVAFPQTNAGYLILLHILTGLALMSYSLLVSSLFRRSQLSAISSIVAALAFAIVAQFAESADSIHASLAGVIATGLLFPPSTYVYVIMLTSEFEFNSIGLQLTNFPPASATSTWNVTAGTFLGFLAIQTVLFPVLAAILEMRLHSTASRSRKVCSSEEMSGAAVRLSGFSKFYRNTYDKRKVVKAVDELNLDLKLGTITALLGANGSGKTTTLRAIAGLETITKGSIEIDGTGGLGLCPQHNVMWDELTVKEHVEIFESLKKPIRKSKEARRAELQRLIRGCDLEIKSSAQSKTLSGGQKRKLQLAMMLSGGSTVCCIDEATSGIDPIARRSVWDILLAERGSRTLLLTTHFLDEAEVLADHVAILSKGKLKAEGSVASLKSQLGDGYRITLEDKTQASRIPDFAAVTKVLDFDHVTYNIPDSPTLASFIAMLEQQRIYEYSLEGPTMEKVFLSLAEEMHADTSIAKELSIQQEIDTGESNGPNSGQGLLLSSGQGCGPARQTFVLFRKRVTILKHNYMPYVAALFVSLLVAGLVTRFFIDFDSAYNGGIPCSNTAANFESTYTEFLTPGNLAYGEFVYGPPSRISLGDLQSIVPNTSFDGGYGYTSPASDWRDIPTVGTVAAFKEYVETHTETLYSGGVFNGAQNSTFAWFAQNGASGPLFMQSLVNQLILNETISFSYQLFAESFTPSNGLGPLIVIFIVLGFSIYPGLFALYPTAERLRNVRAMQYSNGILASSLWLAYIMFDLVFVLLISVLTIVIFAVQWDGWYAIGYLFVVLFLYGLTSTVMSYVVSLLVNSQLAAIAFTAVAQVIISALYFVGYFIAADNAPANDIYLWFNYITYTVGLISPSSNLMRALFISLNQWGLACQGTSLASYPGAISLYGAPILYLTVQFFLLAAFLIFWESGRSLEIFGIRRRHKNIRETDAEKVVQPQNEETRESLERLSRDSNGLSVSNISKSFGSNLAVDNMTFGILPSEKFALLGPNGAGKSTMISLIRGDLHQDRHSNGSIYIANDSLEHTPVAAKNHLGVCPQFDATDSMTLLEHLQFYARARGVPNRKANINTLIRRLGLQEHKNKLVKKLSGGTHRKLSLAIALIANPRVLLLDEPSSGMDPAAKRALWGTLSAISEGRVLLLTTHSMEEAGALCDRAGIMASRMLALGGIDELRRRYGGALYVHLVHRDAPDTSIGDMERMRQDVLRKFDGAQIESRTFGGQLRFSVPETQTDEMEEGQAPQLMRMGRLFQIVEEMKE